MIALVALDASAAGRRLWLGAVMEEVAEVAKTAKAAQARKTLSAQMVVVSGARSNLQAASARSAARSGCTTKGRPRGGRPGRDGPATASALCVNENFACDRRVEEVTFTFTFFKNPHRFGFMGWL